MLYFTLYYKTLGIIDLNNHNNKLYAPYYFNYFFNQHWLNKIDGHLICFHKRLWSSNMFTYTSKVSSLYSINCP